MCIYIYTQSTLLKVHPVRAIRGSNVRDNRGPVRDNRVPPYAIIGVTPYAIKGSLQKCSENAENISIMMAQPGHNGIAKGSEVLRYASTLSTPALSPHTVVLQKCPWAGVSPPSIHPCTPHVPAEWAVCRSVTIVIAFAQTVFHRVF